FVFFFSSRRRHTRFSRDWSSDVCSSDLSKRDLLFLRVLSTLEPVYSNFRHLRPWAGTRSGETVAITARRRRSNRPGNSQAKGPTGSTSISEELAGSSPATPKEQAPPARPA